MLILARHAWSDQAYSMSSDIRTKLNEIARGFQGPGTQLGCSIKYVGRQCAEEVRRCEMLGNAVIVPLMRLGFLTLLAGRPIESISDSWIKQIGAGSGLGDVTDFGAVWDAGNDELHAAGTPIPLSPSCDMPAYGFSLRDMVWCTSKHQFARLHVAPTPLGPLVIPCKHPHYRYKKCRKTKAALTKPKQNRFVPTPRRGAWRPMAQPSKRGTMDLPTAMFHCVHVNPAARGPNRRAWAINAEWVEQLMGFPQGWTDTECE